MTPPVDEVVIAVPLTLHLANPSPITTRLTLHLTRDNISSGARPDVTSRRRSRDRKFGGTGCSGAEVPVGAGSYELSYTGAQCTGGGSV